MLNDAAPAATEAALDVRQALREELLSSLWGAADGSASAADDGDATGVYAAPEAAVVALIAPTAAVLEVLEYSGSRKAEVSASAAYSAAQIATAASAALDVGGGLSLHEIQTIMQHAGTGCPMGPCKGCPQHDVRSGACNA